MCNLIGGGITNCAQNGLTLNTQYTNAFNSLNTSYQEYKNALPHDRDLIVERATDMLERLCTAVLDTLNNTRAVMNDDWKTFHEAILCNVESREIAKMARRPQ